MNGKPIDEPHVQHTDNLLSDPRDNFGPYLSRKASYLTGIIGKRGMKGALGGIADTKKHVQGKRFGLGRTKRILQDLKR